MATVAERQAERERRRREAEERKKQKQQAEQPQPDQVTVVGGDPNVQLGGGTFSILGIMENQALGGAQVVSDQIQFKNRRDQQQLGGVVGQLVGGQPGQQNKQDIRQPAQNGAQPAQNGQPAGAQPAQNGQPAGAQPEPDNPAADAKPGDDPNGSESPASAVDDKDDLEDDVNLDDKGGTSHHRNFVNFLATDDVPESIFGIPVVQDEAQYTEKDIEFFRRNPKAAGFYEMGDEEEVGVQEAWGGANTVERVEFANTTEAERERRRAVADEARPALSAVTPGMAAMRAEADERLRLSTGFGSRGWLAIPKETWNRMDLFEKERMAKASEHAKSAALAAALAAPGSAGYLTVPGLRMRVSDVEMAKQFNAARSVDPAGYAVWANHVLNKGRPTADLLLDRGVPLLHDPQFIVDRFRKMDWNVSPEALRRAGVLQINAAPRYNLSGGIKATPAELQAFDNGVFPFRSMYGRTLAGRNAAGEPVYVPWRLSNHVNTVTPVREYTGVSGAARYWDVDLAGGVPVDPRILNPGAKSRGSFDLFVPRGGGTGVRFDWQERYGLPGYFGGHRLGGPRDWGGIIRATRQDRKGGVSAVKPARGKYPGSLNNPGNVEKRTARRQGEVDSPHERWAKFATPQDGLREMADVIRQIAAVKLAEKGQGFTIRNFAEVYAPRVNKKGKKENDTDKYIRDLSADTGFGADEELARWDEGDMARFLRSVVKFESGAKHSAWFTDEEYAAAAAKLQEGAFE